MGRPGVERRKCSPARAGRTPSYPSNARASFRSSSRNAADQSFASACRTSGSSSSARASTSATACSDGSRNSRANLASVTPAPPPGSPARTSSIRCLELGIRIESSPRNLLVQVSTSVPGNSSGRVVEHSVRGCCGRPVISEMLTGTGADHTPRSHCRRECAMDHKALQIARKPRPPTADLEQVLLGLAAGGYRHARA